MQNKKYIFVVDRNWEYDNFLEGVKQKVIFKDIWERGKKKNKFMWQGEGRSRHPIIYSPYKKFLH